MGKGGLPYVTLSYVRKLVPIIGLYSNPSTT